MQILTNLNLNKNSVDNVVFKPLSAAPENPKMGQVYYNSTDKKQYQFDGTEWKPMGGSEGSMYEVIATEAQTDTEAIATVDAKPKKSDTCIVKRLIAEGKYAYTAYLYDGEKWGAMDGNYSAKNVYFDSDIILTNSIGAQTVTGGSKTMDTTGKSVQEILTMFTTEETEPKATAPAVTLKVPEAGKVYEVGTQVTPTFTAELSAGSYTYGPATGVVASSWSITDTNGGSQTITTAKATGSMAKFTVGKNTAGEDAETASYTITATATHNQGAVPVTNVGNPRPDSDQRIAAGTKKATSGTIKGYRKTFYGTKTTKEGTVNSDYVRTGLTGSASALAAGSKFNITIPVGAMRVIIAYPATLRDVTSIKDVNGMNAEIKSGFTKSTVSVEGANGYTAINYKVYIMDYAKANDKANTYSVTI